jgi:hypothetical protein
MRPTASAEARQFSTGSEKIVSKYAVFNKKGPINGYKLLLMSDI